MAKTKRKARKKKAVDPKAREKKALNTNLKALFKNLGFDGFRVAKKDIAFGGEPSELDHLYVRDNILIVLEKTTGKADKSAHVRKKAAVAKAIQNDNQGFVAYLRTQFVEFASGKSAAAYSDAEFKVFYVYCSYEEVESSYVTRYQSQMEFLSFPLLRYFSTLAKTIQASARFEFYKFLGLEIGDIDYASAKTELCRYEGSLLPETGSGFGNGYQVISFLADPESLIEQAYVLRQEGWQTGDCLYQRLLTKRKINSMRKYLNETERVFVNNLIVTLPADARTEEKNQNSGQGPRSVTLSWPSAYNCVGIIDGQHRLFCYHEGDDSYELKISKLRKKQHLLVTGIIYPPNLPKPEKRRFEARLFLEINDKQTRVKSDLTQIISLTTNPFSAKAIGKAVILGLGKKGALSGHLQQHFYDSGKIKTTSIVSYGLSRVVGRKGEHSFYRIWNDPEKDDIHPDVSRTDLEKHDDVLKRYVDYCVDEINKFLSAFKQSIDPKYWVLDRKESRVLTTTTINGLIYCLRLLIDKNQLKSRQYYLTRLESLTIDWTPDGFEYKSSHWKDLGQKIYDQCFK